MQRFRSMFRILCGLCMVFFACPVWAGYVNNGNGTVTDTSTGLMWQHDTPDNTMTWEQALSYCENSTLAEYTDWRLPTLKELVSLVDYSRYNPTINTTYFPDTAASYYWSSTTLANATASVWIMHFYYGYDFNTTKSESKYYYVRAVRGGQSGSLGNLVIAQQPMSGPPGTTFVQWGTGFTPNSTATLHFKKPDGTEYATLQQPIDAIGHFEIDYPAPLDKPPGTYTWWAVDGVKGASNEVSYEITPMATTLDVLMINPQSQDSFYANFFPYPRRDELISGGTESDTIAADGESRLLIRISADSPCPVTVSEEAGNISQNGSVSSLEEHRSAALSSSVSIQLELRNGRYVGFAVYRAPRDFSIPGYEDKLFRWVNLKIDSPCANVPNKTITLRRTPIIISHGLWSEPDDEMKDFRNDLWNKFTDRSGENIEDYIGFNNCKSENAKAVNEGAKKTSENIYDFLKKLRSKGITVSQVDYLGHSMGGQWGRLVVQNYSKDFLTYNKGYLHKLITLDTPHGGSFIADIGQFIIDTAGYYPVSLSTSGFITVQDYLCLISKSINYPVCDGAIRDLTSNRSAENLDQVSVPSHAFMGNRSIDSACELLSLSSYVPGSNASKISKLLKTSEKILKLINPDYGCENWFNEFDIQIQSDYVVGLDSQTGGLTGEQLDDETHWHMASFTSEVNQRFYELLNKWPDEGVFASGFPDSSVLLNEQAPALLNMQPKTITSFETLVPLGEIQFTTPTNGTMVLPGDQVNVEIALTGTLSLTNLLIMANGSDPVEVINPLYTAIFAVPVDAYGNFEISALGEGVDGNLYAASVTLTVNNSAVLEKVDVSPTALFLEPGQQIDLEVIGTYSDGSTRRLNSETGYISSDGNILYVNSFGTITALATGLGFINVSPALGDPVVVRVEIAAPYMDAAFTSDIQSGPPPLTVAFSDLSAGYLTQCNWDFGDGQTSTDQNPVHAYTSPGTYTVTLTISSAGGTDIETRTNFIRVGATGDVNSDGNADLADAVLCLQVLSGMLPDNVNPAADVDGDGKIGMAEVIYVLQQVAGF
ncbi:MAG: DUF1566 domain-containing protein [Desulfatirhabdiaceae bacterium]